MVHARFSDKYIHFPLMYTTDHIFPVIPIKHLVNQYSEPNTPHKLETGQNKSLSNPCALFYPYVVLNSTSHIDTKVLNMCHQLQKGFLGS